MSGYQLLRFAIVATFLGLCIGLAFTPPAEALTTPKQRAEIRFQRVQHGHWTPLEVRKTIRAAVRRWSVAGGVRKAFAVARCESGFYWRASNAGSYLGVFQQSARYWSGRQNTYDSERWHLGERAFNARANVVVSIRMAHRGGWGPWECA